MATQDLFIHQSFATQQPSFVVISEDEKKKKKNEKELLALGATLKQLEAEIVEAKKGGAVPEDSKVVSMDGVNASDNSNPSYQEAMAEMVLALQILQVEIAKFAQNKAGFDQSVSQAAVNAAQANLKDLEAKIKQMQEDQSKQDTISFWTKFAEIAAAVVITAVALAFGQVEIAILVIAMTAASVSGGFEKATDAIAKDLVNDGLSPEVAHIIAAVIMLVVVIVATALIAPATATADAVNTGEEIASASEETATNSVEMTTLSSNGEGDVSAAQAAQTASNAERLATNLSRIGRVIRSGLSKAWNAYKNLSIRTQLIISNTAQTLPQVDLAQSIADAIVKAEHGSEKAKEMAEIIASAVAAIISLVLGVLSGAALSSGMSRAESVISDSTKIGRLLNRLIALFRDSRAVTAVRNGLSTTKGMAAVETARQVLGATGSGLGIWNGIIELSQGKLQKSMAINDGNIILQNQELRLIMEGANESQKHFADVEKQQSVGDKSISKLVAGEAGFAQLFTQYSPV